DGLPPGEGDPGTVWGPDRASIQRRAAEPGAAGESPNARPVGVHDEDRLMDRESSIWGRHLDAAGVRDQAPIRGEAGVAVHGGESRQATLIRTVGVHREDLRVANLASPRTVELLHVQRDREGESPVL